MFQKLMTGALIAGAVAGLVAAFLHFVFIQDLILLGERYESGEIVHFSASPDTGAHDQAPAAHGEAGEAAHEAGESSDLTRNLLTLAFTVILYSAYAMLLSGGFAIAAQFGLRIDTARGALWGLAGYGAFQLAPAMGLAPELPGTLAADMGARQIWWWSTVVATGLGAALIAYGRSAIMIAIGAVLALVPHLIGAPVLEDFHGSAPAELGGLFAARVLGVGLVAWVTLGAVAGWRWSRST